VQTVALFVYGTVAVMMLAFLIGLPIGVVALVVGSAFDGLRRLKARAEARAEKQRRLRATDADRAAAVRRLAAQCAVGRLRPEELEERAEAAWAARSYAQLERLERDLPPGSGRAGLAGFRSWLYAAAVYNACWGTAVALGAGSAAWKAVGLLVLVYAPAYWWAARDPERHAHLVAIGLLGKVLGIIGFAWAAATGRLPVAFGLVILTNDAIWVPAFSAFVARAAEAHGGWRTFLAGA
jgi:hypothetical protein